MLHKSVLKTLLAMNIQNNPEITIIPATRLPKEKGYRKIVSSSYSSGKLHQFGCLYSLMKKPEQFNETFIAIVRIDSRPVSVVSITENTYEGSLLSDSFLLDPEVKLCFPNFEIMAYTASPFRKQGLVKKSLIKLLDFKNIDKMHDLYVYSMKMEKALLSLGYNAKNLHKGSE